MAASPAPRFTPEQYLALERSAAVKSEYFDGQMFAMAGGSLPHSLLPMRMAAALIQGLKGRGCEVASSDLLVRVSPEGPFLYPDLSVYRGEAQLADEQQDILLNPRVVIEVLSKSSEAYDRGLKFQAYRRIESLREYALVSQTEPRIEIYLGQPEDKWLLSSWSGLDAVCRFQSLGCEVRLPDVYDGVRLG